MVASFLMRKHARLLSRDIFLGYLSLNALLVTILALEIAPGKALRRERIEWLQGRSVEEDRRLDGGEVCGSNEDVVARRR
jgi:hypothetical protein